jgi:hypothetical protein
VKKKSPIKQFIAGFLASGLILGAGAASAAPAYCPVAPAPASATNEDGLSRDNVTFRSIASDGCYGVVSGNDSLNVLNGVGGGSALFGGGWQASVTDGGSDATLFGYLGLNWTLSAPQTLQSGNWTLTIADPPPISLPVAVDMLVVLKGGSNWAGYYFDDEAFTISGSSAGTFNINFLNNGGQIPGLSHMTLYLRPGTPPPPCQPGDPNCGGTVPEPGTIALLGFGLAGMALVRRRRI